MKERWQPVSSVQFSHSVVYDFLWPHGLQHAGFPVHHQFPELTKTHLYWVGYAIQSFHPLVFPSPAFNLSQHKDVFQFFASGGQSIGASASVLSVNIQDWFPLGWTCWISLQSKGLSKVFCSPTVQKHQFFSTQPSLWSNAHICTWLLERPQLDFMDLCQQSNVSVF